MSNHVTLTDDERKEVVGFWADYFRSSGDGRQPTPFQLDAINDPDVRDAFLFWQIGGDPITYNTQFAQRHEALALLELFGANPTGKQVHDALTHLVGAMRKSLELEDMDTASVWTMAHVMWLLLGGAWHPALDEMTQMAEVVGSYNKVNPDNVYPHEDPLSGLGISAALVAFHVASGGDAHGMELTSAMYGLDENSENTRWARETYAQVRAERINKNAAA